MDNGEKIYTVFKRSATSWEQFGAARKYKIESGLTYTEAQRICREFNADRTPAQVRNGTKYEFTGNY